MPKLKITSGLNFIKFFKKLGFIQTRQVGSHVVLKGADIDKDFYQKNI